jgi:hypothetical protein
MKKMSTILGALLLALPQVILFIFISMFCVYSEAKAVSDIDKLMLIELQLEKDISAVTNSHPLVEEAAPAGCPVVHTITIQSMSNGLAWDAGNLWISEDVIGTTNIAKIYEIDLNATILESFNAPGKSSLGARPLGLANDGTFLWSVDFLDGKIYKLTKSGSVVSSIQAPSGISSGLAWDGNNLWVGEWYSRKIYKIKSTDGQIIASFNAPDYDDESNGKPYGLAWDGSHLWASNSNGIYMIDPTTGSVLAACNDSAVKYGQAYGLTWDGHFLWGGSWLSNSIIKIDVSALVGNTLPIALPMGQQVFSYSPTAIPVNGIDPENSKPIGVGSVATGGDTLSLRVGINQFEAPVDFYFLMYFPTLSPGVFQWTGTSFQPFSSGLAPWKQNLIGPINETLFGDLSISALGFYQGKYYLGLLVTPAGNIDLSSYYLWLTDFEIGTP